jgi:hypothetical protein
MLTVDENAMEMVRGRYDRNNDILPENLTQRPRISSILKRKTQENLRGKPTN